MVLPEPAAHASPDQAVGWLDEIALTLRLASGAALVLVNKANPARLGDLARTLRHDFRDIDVIPDVGKLVDVPLGSTIVLTPTRDDAEWLNLRRGQFAERKLKVVLFCDEATTHALKFRAPDFYDWIGRQKDCPPGPAPYAVRGLHAAFEAEWSVAWTGSRERGAVEDAVRAACPGEASVWQSSEAPFEEVVKAMESPGVVLLVDADTPRKLRRARWARAAACRTTRLVLVVGEQDAPGFWPVDDRQMSLAEGCKLLGAAGARTPGRLSALVDLEPDAVRFLASWLKAADEGGSLTTEERMDRLFSMLLPGGGLGDPAALVAAIEALDPGVAIALLALTAAEKKSYFDARSPKLVGERSALRFRAMATRPRVRDAFLAWARTAEPNGAPELGVAVAHSPTRSRDLYLAGLKQDFEKVGRDDWWVETVFRLRPSAPFELLLGAVVELAILGEGDVIAWFLHLVQDPDVQRVLRPVHQRASSEKEPEALLDLLRPAVASLKAEWNRRAALWATVNVLLSGAAAFSLGGGLAAYLTDYGAWVLIPTAVATLSLLWASVVAKKRAVPAWARSAVPGNDLQRRFRAIEARFPPTRTEMEGQLRERLLAIEKKIDSEELAEAEKLARQALLEVRLLEGTAPHQAAAQALASILLARGNRSEATKLIEPFFTGRTAPLTKGLLAFAARLLAETGRATLAVRSLLHLTSATLPTVSNLRAIPESLGEEDVLASRLLSEPRGVLAELPEAHATLVDALLKQGRYPEALVVARAATTKFAGRKGKVVSELAIRTVDLERRIGAVAPAVQGSP